MKTIITPVLQVALMISTAACDRPAGEQTEEQPSAESPMAPAEADASVQAKPAANLVEITIEGLNFIGPDEIRSGWTTIKLTNAPAMTHFAVLERMPEGKGVKALQEEVSPAFQQGMDLLNEGKSELASEKFGEIPEWFGDILFLGGPGLVAANRTTSTTMYLEPGTYVIECYVKTGGIFHSFNPAEGEYGMVHEFTVTEEVGDASEPEPTVHITISSDNGIEVEGDVRSGAHTVAVNFEDQKVYEHFLGHDVHLVQLESDTDMEALAAWMDWRLPDGLETPAPAEFVGGIHEMPEGETGYFRVQLEPGRYAWIAEVPDPGGRGMLKTFAVP